MEYAEAERRLTLAAIAMQQAERDLEDAQARFRQALDIVDRLEQQEIPTFQEMRGILKPDPT